MPGILKQLFSGGAKDLVDSVGKVIDDVTTTKEEKAQKILDAMDKELDWEKLNVEDRANARDMQKAALAQEDKFSKRFVYYLAGFWSLAGIAYIFAATYITIVNVKVADTVLGFLLGTIVATIINFFYGSSKGSADKQDILKDVLSKNK